MDKISVHKATPDDLPALRKIINDAVDFKLSKNDEAWGTEPWTEDEVLEAIGFGNTNIVSVNGKNIGCVDLIWEDVYNWGEPLGTDDQAIYLHRFALLKEFRSKGFGEKIIVWVSELAKSKGRKFIRLECRASNKSLCAYYEKAGFTRSTPENPKTTDAAYYQKSI